MPSLGINQLGRGVRGAAELLRLLCAGDALRGQAGRRERARRRDRPDLLRARARPRAATSRTEFVYSRSRPDGPRGRRNGARYASAPRAAFIFRLAGRDREKSASYYTPEVLTQCVVKYSLQGAAARQDRRRDPRILPLRDGDGLRRIRQRGAQPAGRRLPGAQAGRAGPSASRPTSTAPSASG